MSGSADMLLGATDISRTARGSADNQVPEFFTPGPKPPGIYANFQARTLVSEPINYGTSSADV